MKFVIIFLTLYGLFKNCSSQIDEGDNCRLRTGSLGTCELYSSCRQQLKGQRPIICSYTAQEAIVCCPSMQKYEVYKRISVRKCDEYQLGSRSQVGITKLTVNPSAIIYQVPKCDYSVRLIVGGEVTKPGEFPHMAAIGWWTENYSYDFQCAGSLISDYFVLTAAHCATNDISESPVVVRLGDQNLLKNNDGAAPVDYSIAEFIKHPEYKPVFDKYNDIALIRLASRVSFNKFIRPACLWPSFNLNVTKVIATGYGNTEYAMIDPTYELMKVSLNIYSNGVCQRIYASDRKLNLGIRDSQICCGQLEGGRDTCQGDSGGPIQVTVGGNQCAYYIIGVTSFGKICGGRNSAGIYTRVSSYIDWIEVTVWPY